MSVMITGRGPFWPKLMREPPSAPALTRVVWIHAQGEPQQPSVKYTLPAKWLHAPVGRLLAKWLDNARNGAELQSKGVVLHRGDGSVVELSMVLGSFFGEDADVHHLFVRTAANLSRPEQRSRLAINSFPPAKLQRASSAVPDAYAHILPAGGVPRITMREGDFDRNRPVILTGAVPPSALDGDAERGASLGAAWALERFVALASVGGPLAQSVAPPLHVRWHTAGFAGDPSRWRDAMHCARLETMSAAEYARLIASGVAEREDAYCVDDLRANAAGDRIAPLLDAVSARLGLEEHASFGAMVNAWWGSPGHIEPAHVDVCDGTLLQLHGTKRVVLWPPSSFADLYPFPPPSGSGGGMHWCFSQVGFATNPDAAKHPRAVGALAARLECELQPGEALYIPAMWAHQIEGLRDSAARDPSGARARVKVDHILSVNRFWRTPLSRVEPFLPPGCAPGIPYS